MGALWGRVNTWITARTVEILGTIPRETEVTEHLASRFKDTKYIAGLSGGINAMMLLDGIENGLMEFLLNPEEAEMAIAYNKAQSDFLDDYFVKDYYDDIFLEEDYADSTQTFILPAMFNSFCSKTLSERVRKIKAWARRSYSVPMAIQRHLCRYLLKPESLYISYYRQMQI